MGSSAIAIVGVSAAFPGARSARQLWRNVIAGRDCVGPIPPGRLNGMFDQEATQRRGGFLPSGCGVDAAAAGVPPTLARDGDPDQFFAIGLARDATADMATTLDEARRARTDIIIGRGGYMTNRMADVYLRAEAVEHVVRALPPELGDRARKHLREALSEERIDTLETCMPNLVASRVANRLGFGGAAYVVDGACASSLLAVEQVVSRLRSGHADVGVAMGLHLFQTPGFWYMFDKLGALSPSGTIRPFDSHADGLVPSEGGGAVVCKRVDDAEADGDHIYAIIRGVAIASDGAASSVLQPDSSGQQQALTRALADAGIDPDEVSLIEAHGTATSAGDRSEVETLRRIFGSRRGPIPTRCVGSIKSMIGHAMPAAGMAGLIKTVFALTNKVLPPTLHCETPRPELSQTDFYTTSEARPWIHPSGRPRIAGVNAFGFGGVNAHVVLEEYQGSAAIPFTDAMPMPSQLFVASAPSASELERRLRDASAELASGAGFAAVCRASLMATRPNDHRVAIVADNKADLATKLAAAADSLSDASPAKAANVAIGHGRASGEVAYIFPGVGFPGLIGAYPEHLMTMALHFPEVRDVLDAVEERDAHPDDPTPTSLILHPPPATPSELRAQVRSRVAALPSTANEVPAPHERNISTSCVTVTHWLSFALLRALGARPAMVCGQSQGELAALVAGGALDVSVLLQHAWQNIDIAATYDGGGRLAYAGASEEELLPLLADEPDVEIAIHVSPRSQILAGTEAGIERFVEVLRTHRIMTQGLPYPPVHSSQLEPIRSRIDAMVPEETPLTTPTTPVYSAITTRPFPSDPAEIRELALSNLNHPVRFWQTIRQMYEDGARLFVQVGGGTLAANMSSILDSEDAKTIAMDIDHVHPMTQLQLLCAELFAGGHDVDLAKLCQHRPPAEPNTVAADPLRLDHVPLVPFKAPPIDRPTSAASTLQRQRVYDLDRDHFLRDHVLIGATCSKALESCFPVVPLTALLDDMAKVAAELAPGLPLLGFTDVSAKRWVALRDARTLETTIEATKIETSADGRVKIGARIIEGGIESCSACVELGPTPAPSLQFDFHRADKESEWPFAAGEVYRERHLFHGPLFQCVANLGVLDAYGCTGSIRTLPQGDLNALGELPVLDPVSVDGAMQISGLFVMGRHQRLVLPTAIDALEVYGPRPADGELLTVRVGLRDLATARQRVTTNIEVLYPDGAVWMRIAGYEAIILDYAESVGKSQRRPDRYLSSQRIDDGDAERVTMRLCETDLRNVNVEWLARFVLHESEWIEFSRSNLAEQRALILRLTAIKDAARASMASQGGMPHPASLVVSPRGEGFEVIGPEGITRNVHLELDGDVATASAVVRGGEA